MVSIPFKGTNLFGGELAKLQKANKSMLMPSQFSPIQHFLQPPILADLIWAEVGVVTSREVAHKEEGTEETR